MVINHLEKILVTSDAATIMKEVKKKKNIYIFF
jgi:chaperonin GroEL (HSP60 family)